MKLPAGAEPRPTYSNPRTECDCGGKLKNDHLIEAKLVTLNGIKEVYHQTKRCTKYACRKCYGHNYGWKDGKKYNDVKLDDVDVLFINSKYSFDKGFVGYHEDLQFRGCLSTKVIAL